MVVVGGGGDGGNWEAKGTKGAWCHLRECV